MRHSTSLALCFGLGLALAGCSDSGGGGRTPPGADAGDDHEDGDLEVPANGFQIVTPEISIPAGEEVTYCYYTTLPIDEVVGVKRWESVMTPGSHHMILYFTSQPQKPDGTLDTEPCGIGTGDARNPAIWTYAAQDPETEFSMPEGVGMAAQPQQPVVVQMHYLNAGDADLNARVTINGHIHVPGSDYEQAHPYITYHTGISVPPGEEGSVQGSCAVPDGAQFFTMSTHAHQFSTRAQVLDGDTMLVDSTDWEHPEIVSWVEAPHYSFRGNLDYRCEYFNGSDRTVTTGDSAETDEMCMAVGYYFGADGPYFCLDSTALPF